MLKSVVPPLFEITPNDLVADPDLKVAQPTRLSVALSLVQDAQAAALADYRGLDTKAGSVVTWIAAIFAIALFQNATTTHGMESICEVISFLCLVIALFFAIRAQRPDDVDGAAVWDPMDAYDYQSAEAWNAIQPGEGFTTDQLAEAQTQMRLIQFTDTSIKRLREASTAKQKSVFRSHVFFTVGVGLLGLALLVPALRPLLHWH